MRGSTQKGWTGSARRRASAAVRFCVALWMGCYLAYTPIHLYLEPHAHGEGLSITAGRADHSCSLTEDHQDGGDHHQRHSAEQHALKLTQPSRLVAAEMMPLQGMEWLDPYGGCPEPRMVEFSGLSPPEFQCAWQFIVRAALPVRAPALSS